MIDFYFCTITAIRTLTKNLEGFNANPLHHNGICLYIKK